MSLDTLIIDFTKLNDSIAAAAQNEDEALLHSLDSEILDLFNEILAYSPKTKKQRVTQCSFLLEHLIPVDSRQGTSEIICDRILQLISEA